MRLMLGLDNGRGQTTFDDKRLYEYGQPSKVVGILLEAKAYHPTRSARNHLKVLADAGNIPPARVDEVLDIVGLKEVARKKPGKFSLGMSQRLGVAAAILGQPKYLILDEPANGLDPGGIAWLRDFLKEYADKGNAVFVSSHLLSEMSLMADDVVVIGKGKLITSGSMKSILQGHGHASVFVRSDNLKLLEAALAKAGYVSHKSDGGLTVAGANTDDVGHLAFKQGITVLELAQHNASLEEAFLELTSGSQEFQAKTETKK
jgi:ABC-2 type transport system ATP-binding protein